MSVDPPLASDTPDTGPSVNDLVKTVETTAAKMADLAHEVQHEVNNIKSGIAQGQIETAAKQIDSSPGGSTISTGNINDTTLIP